MATTYKKKFIKQIRRKKLISIRIQELVKDYLREVIVSMKAPTFFCFNSIAAKARPTLIACVCYRDLRYTRMIPKVGA